MLVALVALLTVAVPGIAAAADDAAAVKKVTNLNMKALDAYNKQDYETARALLKEALELCASAGLDKHAIRARTHIHFGVVAIVGFKQREVGLKQFRKALEVQPDIKLTKQLATPELQDAFEEAVLASNDGGGGGAPAGGGEPAGDGEGGGGGTAVADDEGDGEKKPTVRKPAPRKKKGDEEEDAGDGQKGVFFVGLTGGTGFGLIKGNGELDPAAHKLDAPGFAMAQTAQVTPEVGFFISHDLMISLQLRIQYVAGLNGKPVARGAAPAGLTASAHPATAPFAGFAKVTYLLGTAPFHFTVGAQIGGGNIRHALVFPDDKTCKATATETSTQTCVDTVAGGPFLIGPTVGMLYEIGESLNLIWPSIPRWASRTSPTTSTSAPASASA